MTEPESNVIGNPNQRMTAKTSTDLSLLGCRWARSPAITEARSRLRRISPAIVIPVGLAAVTTPLNSRNCFPNNKGLYNNDLATNAQTTPRAIPIACVLVMTISFSLWHKAAAGYISILIYGFPVIGPTHSYDG